MDAMHGIDGINGDAADASHGSGGTDADCVVFGAGEYYAAPPVVPAGAYVVAADGGLDHVRALGVEPDVVVGDFDSLEGRPPAAGDGRTVALPPLKDDPDMLSALKIGWAHGCRVFHIYGALGGRIDHTIANINLLARLAHHGGIGFLHGDGAIVTAICDGALSFPAHEPVPGGMVSVFAHSDTARGIDEPGMRYELRDGTFASDGAQGVSNEFIPGRAASIGVREGTLVVTFPEGSPMPRVTRRHVFSGDLGPLDTAVSPLLVRD